MSARTVATKVAVTAIVAYYGLALVGALGNRSWALVGLLSLAPVYLAVSAAADRRARSHRPATVPADTSEGR